MYLLKYIIAVLEPTLLYFSTHSVNGERILGQLRALKANYGSLPNQSITGVTIR